MLFYSPEELKKNIDQYAYLNKLDLNKLLGRGIQGIVWSAKSRDSGKLSAIKCHNKAHAYNLEKNVYLRLREHKVYKVRDFNIPRLIAFDDVLQIIEMSWLSPPFLVDFGGAYVDKAPEHLFDPELREEWLAKGAEEFGENWGVVLAILADLETMYGIYLADINTRNIQF